MPHGGMIHRRDRSGHFHVHRIECARFEKNGVANRGIAQVDEDVDALGRCHERFVAAARRSEQARVGAEQRK